MQRAFSSGPFRTTVENSTVRGTLTAEGTQQERSERSGNSRTGIMLPKVESTS